MNQTVKIFFTDMDDTLLNSKKQVTKENMDAISEACLLRFFKDHACIFERNRAAVQRFLCRAVVNQSAVECDGIAAFAVESELF